MHIEILLCACVSSSLNGAHTDTKTLSGVCKLVKSNGNNTKPLLKLAPFFTRSQFIFLNKQGNLHSLYSAVAEQSTTSCYAQKAFSTRHVTADGVNDIQIMSISQKLLQYSIYEYTPYPYLVNRLLTSRDQSKAELHTAKKQCRKHGYLRINYS